SHDQQGRPTTEWINPPLELEWGPYVKRGAAEKLASAQAAAAAETFLTRRSLVQAMAQDWGIEDVESELGQAGTETAAKGQAAKDLLAGLAPQAGDGPVDPHAKDPQAALNGAQVESLVSVITQVAAKALPRETGIGIMTAAFP